MALRIIIVCVSSVINCAISGGHVEVMYVLE